MNWKRLSPYALALLMAASLQIGWTFLSAVAVQTAGEFYSSGNSMYETAHFDIDGSLYAYRTEIASLHPYDYTQTYHLLKSAPAELSSFLSQSATSKSGPATQYGHHSNRWLQGAETSIERPEDLRLAVELFNNPYYQQARLSEGEFLSQDIYLVTPPRGQGSYFELFDRKSRSPEGFVGTRGRQTQQPTGKERFHIGGYVDWPFGHRNVVDDSQIQRYSENPPNSNRADLKWIIKNELLSQSQKVILSNGKVYLVDLRAGTTTDLFPSRDDAQSMTLMVKYPRPTKLGNSSPALGENPARDEGVAPLDRPSTTEGAVRYLGEVRTAEMLLMVRTRSSLVLFHPTGGIVEQIPLPADVTEGAISITSFAGGFGIIQGVSGDGDPTRGFTATTLSRVWWIVGGEVSEQELVMLATNYTGVLQEPAIRDRMIALIAGAPITAAVVNLGIVPWFESQSNRTSFAATVGQVWLDTWGVLLLIVIAGGLLAWMADRKIQQHHLARSWGWMCFVFLLGLPGYLSFLLHRRWPLTQPAATPIPTGLEIFA